MITWEHASPETHFLSWRTLKVGGNISCLWDTMGFLNAHPQWTSDPRVSFSFPSDFFERDLKWSGNYPVGYWTNILQWWESWESARRTEVTTLRENPLLVKLCHKWGRGLPGRLRPLHTAHEGFLGKIPEDLVFQRAVEIQVLLVLEGRQSSKHKISLVWLWLPIWQNYSGRCEQW